jgi:hypothetical protein
MNAADLALSSCRCTICSANIEFAPSRAGETVDCPRCGMQTVLFLPAVRKAPPPPPPDPRARYCTRCGAVGIPRSLTKGSILIEIALWLVFLIPGIIYSLWRLSTRAPVCPQCCSPEIIPTTSPRAQSLMRQQNA